MLLELQQRLPRGDLDDAAEYVGRMAVVPAHAGLIGERQFGDPLGEFGIVEIAGVQRGLRIELFDLAFAKEAVSDTRGVPQQVQNRDRTLQRLELERILAGLIGKIDADLGIGESRNVFRDGIVERQLAVLDQHHDCDRGDRLGHRIDPEDGIRRHRQPGRDAAQPETFQIDLLAVLLDQQHRAGNLAARNLVADDVAKPIEVGA